MAAETIAQAGLRVVLLERMPSVGRKLLMAGRGGLNLTHAEALPQLMTRYGAARQPLGAAIAAHPPASVIAWCEGLGQSVFTGSSRRVFPQALKASPLLRAWLVRLGKLGVEIRTRQEWLGWEANGALRVAGLPGGLAADATVLALGGASWPRLGSDGRWTAALTSHRIAQFQPANCGFTADWSAMFRDRFEGQPLKRIALRFGGTTIRGEAMITATGIEGGAVYALSAMLRDAIATSGPAILHVDLRPDLETDILRLRLQAPRASQSLSTWLRKTTGLAPVGVGLVQEALHAGAPADDLAGLIKALPVRLLAPGSIARAISTAGGLCFEELDSHFMLIRRPGVFAAGEMLDWEAPTGGYLLQAVLSTGAAAGQGVLRWLGWT
jgi:uncharacterized flavoprotein (TIGR03862 family)